MIEFETILKVEFDQLRSEILKRLPTRKLDKEIIVEVQKGVARLYVPYFFSIFEHGRGKRKSNVNYELWRIIKEWMLKKGMITAQTPTGQDNQAKRLTYYINKYGTRQYRLMQYKDIFSTLILDAVERMNEDLSEYALNFLNIEISNIISKTKTWEG